MWWEALPSLAVIGVAMAMPDLIAYFTHRLLVNTPYRRHIQTGADAHYALRDLRLSGNKNYYIQKGLECCPPEPEDPPECVCP